MSGETESLYRLGVAKWADRDLGAAVEKLSAAVEAGSIEENWWHAASRALAQIALELDDLEAADRHLRRLPEDWIGTAQTSALRAKRFLLGGDGDAAAVETSLAVGCVAAETSDDIGSLMNGAMAMAWCAEVLAELGFANEVIQLGERARRRMSRAGIDDPVIGSVVTLSESSALRLLGRLAEASQRLESVDTALSPDLEALALRERARIALDSGDRVAADRMYGEARSICADAGYQALVRLIDAESIGSPPALKTDLDPVEEWAERRMEEALAQSRPYAVVVRMVVTREPQRLLDLTRNVHHLLTERPGLGSIDGTGTDGVTWEFFLDGGDGPKLWEAIEPIVRQFGPEAGSEVEVWDGERIELIGL